ncbi:putative benzoate 4-monooxygenase cytochrome P450 [Xylogone sp. PMI_703]|nr:putative benzoate 4-monooxygenase cytochrome P450 [Xylogone sp. PMI_703]
MYTELGLNVPFYVLIFATIFILSFGYVIYYRYLHPLAKYPGPFLASLTNFWKAYHYWKQDFHHNMLTLHDEYGSIVRIGPNDLAFNGAEAIAPIYKSGRHMPKSVFYDAFTAFKPNVFGTRDETLHGLRRRQLAHAFAISSLKSMEAIFDIHINNLMQKVKNHAESGTVLDLKSALGFYGYDVTGQLAFDREFSTQVVDDPEQLPPLCNHFLMGNLYGAVGNLLPYIRTYTSWIPWCRQLAESRAALAKTAAESVQHAIANHKSDTPNRTLLTSLINAKDPETGAKLSVEEINSEAFGFLVAGSHTTGGTLTILFYHLLRNPQILASVVEEIDTQLSSEPQAFGIYEYGGLESKLPYTLACLREGFRITPIAAHLLPREVINPQGVRIGNENIPQGTACTIINHCLHHNPDIWGADHNVFEPSRFLPGSKRYDPSYPGLLLHFGTGPRQCIGRNIALVSIWKILTSLLKKYEFELLNLDEELETVNFGVVEKKGPLNVKVKLRTASA